MKKPEKVVIILFLLTVMPVVLAASVWTTDINGAYKNDFAPAETVYIHGSGFIGNTDLDVTIRRPDGSVNQCNADTCHTRFTDGRASTYTSGDFAFYVYDLNGIEGQFILTVSDGTTEVDYYFTDRIDAVTVLFPNGGETLSGIVNISFFADRAGITGSTITLYYSKNGCSGPWTSIGSVSVPSDGNYVRAWNTAGDADGTNYCIRTYDNEILDPDSDTSNAVFSVTNGITCTDNDGDGYAVEGGICGDVDCSDNNDDVNPGENEACGDGVDNDCNGDTDLDDGNCALCRNCGAGESCDEDGDHFAAIGQGCSLLCGLCGFDVLDCNDDNAEVNPGIEEKGCFCFDDLDNDCSLLTDEHDIGCWCMNGRDDTGEGLIDCADPLCTNEPFCGEEVPELLLCSVEACGDGFDNDGDGLVDANDPDCSLCGNGVLDEGEECELGDVEVQQCGQDVGACEFGNQTRQCVECSWSEFGECTGGKGPESEICDGLDNDCNEATDEGFDADGDTVANCFDQCSHSRPNEWVNEYGCDPFQFCGLRTCGLFCELADFISIGDKPEENPMDCITVMRLVEGTHVPACVPTTCTGPEEQDIPR